MKGYLLALLGICLLTGLDFPLWAQSGTMAKHFPPADSGKRIVVRAELISWDDKPVPGREVMIAGETMIAAEKIQLSPDEKFYRIAISRRADCKTLITLQDKCVGYPTIRLGSSPDGQLTVTSGELEARGNIRIDTEDPVWIAFFRSLANLDPSNSITITKL